MKQIARTESSNSDIIAEYRIITDIPKSRNAYFEKINYNRRMSDIILRKLFAITVHFISTGLMLVCVKVFMSLNPHLLLWPWVAVVVLVALFLRSAALTVRDILFLPSFKTYERNQNEQVY